MSSKNTVNPGTVLSVFCLLLYSAGFIRIELKFNGHDQRLVAVEEAISRLKHGMEATSAKEISPPHFSLDSEKKSSEKKLHRITRRINSNPSLKNSSNLKEFLEDVVISSFKKMCHTRSFNVCPQGMPGPPGRRGKKGIPGVTGPPGEKGKQGITGPAGVTGTKGTTGNIGPPGIPGTAGETGAPGIPGAKGNIGPPGIPGMKGEPGESISVPNVTISPSELTINESITAVLFCSATGNPVPQVTWSRVSGSLPSNRTNLTSDGLMQIVDVRLEDAGKYKCFARNVLGSDEKAAKLTVRSPPRIALSFGPSYAEKDKNFTLPTCHVTSYPPAVITWSKVFGELSQSSAVLKDGQLSIMNAQKKDSGLYKCKASNSLGRDVAVTQLNVLELPQFTISPPAKLELGITRNITVPCQVTGDPEPTVTWMKENGQLPSGRSKVSVDGTLEIWNATEEDSGRYSCVASSAEVFKTTSAMMLTVKGCGPAGVADRNTVPDYRMTASSSYTYTKTNRYNSYSYSRRRSTQSSTTYIYYYPSYGRLSEGRGGGAWCAKNTYMYDRTDYLQVDMGTERSVCAVATQGARGSSYWTSSYKLHLSTNGTTWNAYEENGIEKVFPGNTDQHSIVKHSLNTDVRARYVRFYPVSHYSRPCLRVEVFMLK